MSVALLLLLGVATSSQAGFIGHGASNSTSPGEPVPVRRHLNQSHAGLKNLTTHFGIMMRVAPAEQGSIPQTIDEKPVPVPEPSIIALFGLGLFGLGLARRRIRK
jgi:hypothetical protein